MEIKANLDNITIVLKQPRFSENIGAAARAACNMGIKKIIIINPENYDIQKIMRLATQGAKDVVDNIRQFDDLEKALKPFQYVAGTTARLGGIRQAIVGPAKFAAKAADLSINNSIAILFGTEDKGLLNEDVRLCHTLINIRTSDFSSLNLAQSVMVVCYEIFKASFKSGVSSPPKLAPHHQLESMYSQLQDILVKIDYIKPENPEYWLQKVRHSINNLKLGPKEVSKILGICRQINWYSKKCYEDGMKAGELKKTE